jgi:ribosome biogenesis GTPase
MYSLDTLGFGPFFATAFAPYAGDDRAPGRVAASGRGLHAVLTAEGEVLCTVAGKLRHEAPAAGLPVTGDWVVVAAPPREPRGTIQAVLPRRTVLSRQAAGEATCEQALAANVDTVFLVCGLDRDFNPRRIERAMVLARASGADAVVVLNKADLCDDLERPLAAAGAAAPGVPVHAVSSTEGVGLEALSPYLGQGRTVVLLGSSGAGKSTLTNGLAIRDVQQTGHVHAADGRGRHTTTRRELIPLPTGAWALDTPGIRELQLWGGEDAAEAAFEDVAALAAACRFADCSHLAEPACAVREAVAEGRLAEERLAGFLKLARELERHEQRQAGWRRHQETRKLRAVHRQARRFRPRD